MALLKLSGFGDEIAEDFEAQLGALRAMDLNFIALRNLWGVNVLDLAPRQVRRARALLRRYGVGVSEIASPVGKVRIDSPWAPEWRRFETALARAREFACPRIRLFSYYSPPGEPRERHRGEVIRRLSQMADRAEREGVILLHENDEGIYGEDGLHCLDLIRSVGSPNFRLAFDPANFVRTGSRPLAQWWEMLKDHVVHLHVKDCDAEGRHYLPGAGQGEFPALLAELRRRDFVGFATMEPHLAEAGQFSGFSGERRFAEATAAFRALCDAAGVRRRQTRVAVVGMGFAGGVHAEGLRQLDEACLVAVADERPTPSLKRARAEWNVEAYEDLRPLWRRRDIEAVTIGTPSGLHGPIAVAAARSGKHVLTEKPIEVTLAKADAMIAAARRHGVKLGVISQHRTDPGVEELRRAIASGRLGRIILAEAYVKWHRTQAYYDSGGWRGTWRLDGGGALMNQGIHTVDVLQHVMGSAVESVVAQTGTLAHEQIEVEDVAQALLRFHNGALGLIVATTAAYPGFHERVEVSGTGGTMIVEKDQVTFRAIVGEPESAGRSEEAGGGAADPRAISTRGHAAQLRDFIAAIQEDREPLVPGPEGRKPLEIILAIYESARTGRRVRLPLRPKRRPPPRRRPKPGH